VDRAFIAYSNQFKEGLFDDFWLDLSGIFAEIKGEDL